MPVPQIFLFLVGFLLTFCTYFPNFPEYRDRDEPLTTTPSSAEVKDRVELYLYPPLSIHDLFKEELQF